MFAFLDATYATNVVSAQMQLLAHLMLFGLAVANAAVALFYWIFFYLLS